MTPDHSRLDREVTDALNASLPRYDRPLEALAARIDVAARRPLEQRRHAGGRIGAWWDFAAAWANPLIPVGVTLAVAGLALLWLVQPETLPQRSASTPSASPTLIVRAARPGGPAPDLVDLAVEDLVKDLRGAPTAGGRP